MGESDAGFSLSGSIIEKRVREADYAVKPQLFGQTSVPGLRFRRCCTL